MSAAKQKQPWAVFKVVDAVGNEFLNTGTHPDYEADFRKHVAEWKRWVKTKDYTSKVPWHRHPVFPCKVVVERIE